MELSGFAAGRSTIYRIITLNTVIQSNKEFQRPIWIALVDLKAAFDSVDRKALWKLLICCIGAFYPWNPTSGGNDLNDFPTNQLVTFRAVWSLNCKGKSDQHFPPPGYLRSFLSVIHFAMDFAKFLQFCLGSNVATRPIDSFTNKKSFNVSWLKLARMSDLIMKTNKSLIIHRVQKINTTLWCRAGKNIGFLQFF